MQAPLLPSPLHTGEQSCSHVDVGEELEVERQLQVSLHPPASLPDMEIPFIFRQLSRKLSFLTCSSEGIKSVDVQGQLTLPNIICFIPSTAGRRERASDEQREESQTSPGRVRAGQSPKTWCENTQTRFVSKMRCSLQQQRTGWKQGESWKLDPAEFLTG